MFGISKNLIGFLQGFGTETFLICLLYFNTCPIVIAKGPFKEFNVVWKLKFISKGGCWSEPMYCFFKCLLLGVTLIVVSSEFLKSAWWGL